MGACINYDCKSKSASVARKPFDTIVMASLLVSFLFSLILTQAFLLSVSDARERVALGDGCPIKLPTDVPKNEPVYLEIKPNGAYDLFVPTGAQNVISKDKKIVLLCPGSKNSLSNGNEATAELTCTANKFDTELNSVNCTKQVSGELQLTEQLCGSSERQGRGNVALVGFTINEQFVELFRTCYNLARASAIYSSHTLYGKVIKYSVKESKRINFKETGIPKRARADKNYRIAAQILHFNKILGPTQEFFSNKSFLSRGHLAPDGDFIFASGQFATYFYANAHPQFQAVNAGNFLRVEALTRTLAADLGEDLTVYTGVHDQLKLPNDQGELIELYLTDDKLIEVPKWTWKVVESQKSDSAIVFITLNDPFANKREIVEFCPNVCREAGFGTKAAFEATKKGYTFCCALSEFRKVVKTLPVSLKAKNLLINPTKSRN